MKEEENNKEIEQNDTNNEKKIMENDTNTNYGINNSEVLRQVNREKIKINEEKLKDIKEQTMEIKSDPSGSQSQNTIDIATKNNNPLMQSTASFAYNHHYYSKINRCLTARIKKLILIVLLIISVFFVLLSAFDIINSKNKTLIMNNNKLLMNNLLVFFIQMIYANSLIFFQGVKILLERKENFLFNAISILFILIIIIFRTIIVAKNNNEDNDKNTIFNFLCSLCLTIINLGIFLVTLKIIKMKKNVQQNIEEIINFSDVLQATNDKISDRKDNQLILNNSGVENKQEIENDNNQKGKKDGISQLVEESNNPGENNPQIEQK